MKPSAKSCFGVDVVCVRGVRLLSTEFIMKFTDVSVPSDADGVSVNIHCNGVLCDVNVKIYPDKYVYFIEDDSIITHFPSTNILKKLNLRQYQNILLCGNEEYGYVEFSVWLWDSDKKIAVVDIDGTITRSNIRGYFETVFLGTYDYIHAGVVPFLLLLDNMGIQIVYLTARPRSHLSETRDLLKNMSEDGIFMPQGPLFTHPQGTMKTLYMEIVTQATATFKYSVLFQICELYRKLSHENTRILDTEKESSVPPLPDDGFEQKHSESESTVVSSDSSLTPVSSIPLDSVDQKSLLYKYRCPLVLGVGNKDTDSRAYYCSGVPISNVLMMKTSGEVVIGGYTPSEQDIESHKQSRSRRAIVTQSSDIIAGTTVTKKEIVSVTPPDEVFSSYGDPLLHAYIKSILLKSSKDKTLGVESTAGLGAADV